MRAKTITQKLLRLCNPPYQLKHLKNVSSEDSSLYGFMDSFAMLTIISNIENKQSLFKILFMSDNRTFMNRVFLYIFEPSNHNS